MDDVETVQVEAWNPVVSDCLPGGIDVDVTVRFGAGEVCGEVTLCHDDVNGGWVAYGNTADMWVSRNLLAALESRGDRDWLRGVLAEVEAAAVSQVTDDVAEAADDAGARA